MMQTKDIETLDSRQPVVTITTTDTSMLLPALLGAGASVMLKRDKLAVRGLTTAEVARIAAAQLAFVTDLTSATSSPIEKRLAVLSGVGQ